MVIISPALPFSLSLPSLPPSLSFPFPPSNTPVIPTHAVDRTDLRWKVMVGPLGSLQNFMLMNSFDKETTMKWVTPKGPATATKSFKTFLLRTYPHTHTHTHAQNMHTTHKDHITAWLHPIERESLQSNIHSKKNKKTYMHSCTSIG